MPFYGKCMHCWGECCGCLRTWIPCIFCCCVQYPYKTVPQSFQGIYQKFGRYVRTVKPGLHYINPCTETLGMISMKINVLDLARQVKMTKIRTSLPRTMCQLTSMPQFTTESLMLDSPTIECKTSTLQSQKSPTLFLKILVDSLFFKIYYKRDKKSQMTQRNKWISMWSSGAQM